MLLDIPKSRRSPPAAASSLPPPPPLWRTATTDPAAAALMARASRSAATTPVGASSRIGAILPTLLANRTEAAQNMKAQLQQVNEEWEDHFAKQSQWHREEVTRMATQLEAARSQAAEHIAALTAENNSLREEVRRLRAAARMAGIDCSIMAQEKKALQEAMGENVVERLADGQRAALEREVLRAEKEHWADASEMRAKVARLRGEEAARTKMADIVEQVLAEQAAVNQAMADELVAARQRAAEAQHQRQLAEAKFTECKALAVVRATELAKVAKEKEALAIAMATQTETERSNATKLKVETSKCEQLRASQAAAYDDLLHAQKAHREATESAKAAAKAEMEAALARYKDTKAKHHAVKGTCAKLKRELATAHEEKERVEGELSALETRYAKQEEELQQQAKRVAAQAKQLETFKSTLEDAKARTEAARTAMATLREKTGEDESTTSRVRAHPPSSPSSQPSERKKRRRSQPRSAQRVQEAAA